VPNGNLFLQEIPDCRFKPLKLTNTKNNLKVNTYLNFQRNNLSNDFLKTLILLNFNYPLLKSVSYYDAPIGNFILDLREEYYYDGLNRVSTIMGYIKKDITDKLIVE
jgi:hypothetical protein